MGPVGLLQGLLQGLLKLRFSRESCLFHYLATDTPCLPTSEDIRICLWFRLLGALSQVSREPSPSSPYEKSVRTSLEAPWLTLCFPTPVVWVRSLVRKLRSHMIWGQKTKTWKRSNIVANSIKTYKHGAHQKKSFKKRSTIDNHPNAEDGNPLVVRKCCSGLEEFFFIVENIFLLKTFC